MKASALVTVPFIDFVKNLEAARYLMMVAVELSVPSARAVRAAPREQREMFKRVVMRDAPNVARFAQEDGTDFGQHLGDQDEQAVRRFLRSLWGED